MTDLLGLTIPDDTPDLSALVAADGTPFDTTVPFTEPEGLSCPDCDKGPFKNASGLKRHRTIAHGGNKDADGISVPRRLQKDLPGKGAPTVDQLTVASGRLLGYGSIAVASIVVDDDPRRPYWTDEYADRIVDELSATPDEAKDIMRPLARIFAGTTLNKRVGRKIVDNMDAADSVVALVMMSRRWSRYLAERKQAGQTAPTNQPSPPPDTMTKRIKEQDMRQGIVATPDMVRS